MTYGDALIAVAIGVAAWLLRNYGQTYAQEKAKNLATKQDIEMLTGKIESVKATYAFDTAQRMAFAEQRREALLNFFDCGSSLMRNLNRDITKMPIRDEEVLWDHQRNTIDLFGKARTKYHRLELYLPYDHPVTAHSRRFVNQISEAQKQFKYNFPNLRKRLLDEVSSELGPSPSNAEVQRYGHAADKTHEARDGFEDAIDPPRYEMGEALQEYKDAARNFLRPEDSNVEASPSETKSVSADT